MNNILLIGCSGEIGSRLTNLLLNNGFKVYGIRGKRNCHNSHPMHECRELDLLQENLDWEDFRPDVLIHTAWVTKPGIFWNSELNMRWVEVSKQIIGDFIFRGGKYLVVTGSCAEYSWENQEPLDELSSEKPVTAYGSGRLELLNWIRSQNTPFLWTRTFFQFGMNEAPGRLVPSLIDTFGKNQKFIVLNRGHLRDFVFVEDVVQILGKLVILRKTGVVNVGSGIGRTIEDMSELVMSAMGKKDLIEYGESSIEKDKVVSDTLKLNSIIGEYRWTPIEEAILRSINARIK